MPITVVEWIKKDFDEGNIAGWYDTIRPLSCFKKYTNCTVERIIILDGTDAAGGLMKIGDAYSMYTVFTHGAETCMSNLKSGSYLKQCSVMIF
eukprot:9790520-Ditylum_brightwellii.AAC.1